MIMDLTKLTQSRAVKEPGEFSIPVKELCDRYARLYSGAINDVLRERNLLYQTLPINILPLRDHMATAGVAFTIKGSKNLSMENEMVQRAEMLEAIQPDSVVVWDTSGDDESAQWGEVMTMAAVRRGCRGAVIDGGVRDTHKVLAQNFPVFARYRTSSGMLGRFRIIGYQMPIQIGRVHIFPGDIVFGDIDGVLIIPREIAVDVLLRAEEIERSEVEIKKWVNDGLSPQEVVKRGGYF
jgi:regulator of RNase E activity RraA